MLLRYQVLDDVGAPGSRIVQKSRLYDLIMLGQQTYFRFETQDWPDETLQYVLRQSSRPVVAVPETPADGTCVVVAYDGSPQADRALQAFQALRLGGGDEVHVVSTHADRATAEGLAKQPVDFLKLHGIRAIPHPLDATMSSDRMILDQVQEVQAHLLVMGACGRSMWREFVFGSTTRSVLRASPVPLLLCG